MQKRGYFVTLDAFFAVTILTIGLVLMFNTGNTVEQTTQPLSFAQDAMDFYGSTKLQEINSNYIDSLRRNGTVTNLENTLFQQAAEFYFGGSLDDSRSFIQNLYQEHKQEFSNLYKMEVLLDGKTLLLTGSGFATAQNVYSVKGLVFGVKDTEPYGPYVTEVRLWI